VGKPNLFIHGKMGFYASPEYFDIEGVEERIKRACPDARFIVLLREPVSGAWSLYWHEVLINKIEKLPFVAIQRSEACFCSQFFFSYLSRGRYVDHLERWFSVSHRQQFRIYFTKEFYSTPNQYFIDVQNWLGLEPKVTFPDFPKHSSISEYPEVMDDEVRSLLLDYYKPYNERLKVLLGREELP